jgi:hypothetical protein
MVTSRSPRRSTGNSLHAPATAENVNAIGRLAAAGVRQVFLDKHGYAANKRTELTGAIQTRQLTPMVRQWIDF